MTVTAVKCVDAAEGAQARDWVRQRPRERRRLDLALDRRQLRPAHGGRAHEVVEGGLRGGLLEGERLQPELVAHAPAAAPRGRALAVAEQEALHPLPGDAAVVLQVLARPHEVAQRLLGRAGHAHRRELAGAVQAGEVARVAAVGLDVRPAAPRDQRGGDHLAGHAEIREQAPGVVAGRSGLVAGAQRRSVRVARQQLAQRRRGVGDHALIALAGAGPQHRHGDGLLVDVEPDVCKLLHGRSLRVWRRGPNPADDPRYTRKWAGHLIA